jgi:hypothetical protein
VEDGGVVAPVERLGDGWEGEVGELARQVHGDLSGADDGRCAARGEDGANGGPEARCGRLLNRACVGADGG